MPAKSVKRHLSSIKINYILLIHIYYCPQKKKNHQLTECNGVSKAGHTCALGAMVGVPLLAVLLLDFSLGSQLGGDLLLDRAGFVELVGGAIEVYGHFWFN